MPFTILSQVKTPDEPDVLLFSNTNPPILIVGTYHLREDNSRVGSLIVYNLDVGSGSCQLFEQIHCAGAVLDMKWHAVTSNLLVVAVSTGRIELYILDFEAPNIPHLSHAGSYEEATESTLLLSLAVDINITPCMATLSTGEALIFDLNDGAPNVMHSWKAHSLEAWCGAWKTSNSVMTGGDDGLLKLWDLRDLRTPQSVCRSHNAGVVSIFPLTDMHFLSGSYDNCLRLFDYRNLRNAESHIDLDGGVWRILPRPGADSTTFLTCCMQAGGRIVSHDTNNSILKREDYFEPGEANRLIYGGSWQSDDVVALCSFYEKTLYICRTPISCGPTSRQ